MQTRAGRGRTAIAILGRCLRVARRRGSYGDRMRLRTTAIVSGLVAAFLLFATAVVVAARVPDVRGQWFDAESGATVSIEDGRATFQGLYLENGEWNSASRSCDHVGTAIDGHGTVTAGASSLGISSRDAAWSFGIKYGGPWWDKTRVLLVQECGPDRPAVRLERRDDMAAAGTQ